MGTYNKNTLDRAIRLLVGHARRHGTDFVPTLDSAADKAYRLWYAEAAEATMRGRPGRTWLRYQAALAAADREHQLDCLRKRVLDLEHELDAVDADISAGRIH